MEIKCPKCNEVRITMKPPGKFVIPSQFECGKCGSLITTLSRYILEKEDE